MKALVKAKSERGLWLQEVPEPAIGINERIDRVDRTGIARIFCSQLTWHGLWTFIRLSFG